MKRRIRRFSVLRTASVFALMYVLAIAVIALPIGVIILISGASIGRTPGGVFGFLFIGIVTPILYGVIIWLFLMLMFAMYNLAARWTGGIEVEVQYERPMYDGGTYGSAAGSGPYGQNPPDIPPAAPPGMPPPPPPGDAR